MAPCSGGGALVCVPKTAVAGIGWLAYVKDPDGNLFGMLEADMKAASTNRETIMDNDEQAIRDVISTWRRAMRTGDIDAVLDLMTPDGVLLVAGRPAVQGKAAFEVALRGMLATHSVGSSSEIDEVCVAGDMAYCRTRLSVTAMSTHGATPVQRNGHTLSILRKDASGTWRVARDADLLAPAD